MVDCFTRVHKEQGVYSFWRGNVANVVSFFLLSPPSFPVGVHPLGELLLLTEHLFEIAGKNDS